MIMTRLITFLMILSAFSFVSFVSADEKVLTFSEFLEKEAKLYQETKKNYEGVEISLEEARSFVRTTIKHDYAGYIGNINLNRSVKNMRQAKKSLGTSNNLSSFSIVEKRGIKPIIPLNDTISYISEKDFKKQIQGLRGSEKRNLKKLRKRSIEMEENGNLPISLIRMVKKLDIGSIIDIEFSSDRSFSFILKDKLTGRKKFYIGDVASMQSETNYYAKFACKKHLKSYLIERAKENRFFLSIQNSLDFYSIAIGKFSIAVAAPEDYMLKKD